MNRLSVLLLCSYAKFNKNIINNSLNDFPENSLKKAFEKKNYY